ncbi:SCO family protein [Falsirhodobacter sp. alg1]|uniref:SCO family protein n=1 Tax=Falsirhodobacter sp. alg1 TaxID=1472418 RepID=UPI0005EE4F39|nr:SCO family protein [Falsirhodobacter sp. alg1]
MKMLNLFLPVVGAVAAILVAAALWFVLAPRISERADTGLGRGDYVLQSTDGTTFTQSSLEGKPTAVFFGFTHCPDVCPTTLGDMMGWQERLGADAEKLRILFVTVDPERDSLDMLRDYVTWLPNAQALTGTQSDVTKAENAFRVFTRKVELGDGDYTMEHTSKVMLFNTDGTFSEAISYQEDPDSAVAKIRKVL